MILNLNRRIDFHEYNKNKLTIIFNDHQDYNVETAWNKGCQFVPVNYQFIDLNTNLSLNKFKDKSILLKPSNLRRNVFGKQRSLNELYPDPSNSTKYIDYKFYQIEIQKFLFIHIIYQIHV